MLKRIALLTLAALALAAVAVPAAGAEPAPRPAQAEVEVELFDLHVSSACGSDVFAIVSAKLDTRIQRDRSGAVRAMTETLRGHITWFTRDTGKSYSSPLANVVHTEFPQGLEPQAPARITVVGLHGGTFPIGGGPPGAGVLVYDGTVVIADEDRPFVVADGSDPLAAFGNFASTTRRICAALS